MVMAVVWDKWKWEIFIFYFNLLKCHRWPAKLWLWRPLLASMGLVCCAQQGWDHSPPVMYSATEMLIAQNCINSVTCWAPEVISQTQLLCSELMFKHKLMYDLLKLSRNCQLQCSSAVTHPLSSPFRPNFFPMSPTSTPGRASSVFGSLTCSTRR